ncbi:hypothetical protein BDM02DRAFT_3113693 [Thelephora ganbajun]|uniref:Uncharacterized protein n=1 Tax=Thelephora ganbajun TaxID=370292 RepID=A0ACB6ZI69_THEGA|nr:hypothetical protein BDM02DRAFT_3113693 [Thelephora ganbajun]
MRFSTIFTVLAVGAMAFAGAVPEIVAKRSITDITNAFNDLSNKCDTILSKFDNCWDDTCSDAIVVELVGAIDVCTTSLGGLTGGLGTPALATVVANVVIKIADSLDVHKTKCGSRCPNLLTTYGKVDVSLSACLTVCFNLCIGLAVLVSALLVNLVVLLKGISLFLVLKVCLLV